MKTQATPALAGGEFLTRETPPGLAFIPEDFNEEQRLMADSAREFLAAEVLPHLDRIDAQEPGLMESIMDKAGELGLLGITVPEAYGGLGKDFITGMRMTEVLGAGHSFSVAIAAHTGIGTLPILYFGTEAQRKKYLPKLTSGEWKASYCLTEPGSGSDALSAKTRADLSPDGKHYILNGQKMWITNAGFADLFVVFAQVGGDQFTGLVVEKESPGLTLGEEEHKMGIKGSSTRQVFFSDCKIPADAVLGEIGQGHRIAFNILNIGRAKLAAATVGGAKAVIDQCLRYALERQQFGLPIVKFGAIRHKIAEQAIRTYACEAALYRVAGMIEDRYQALAGEGAGAPSAMMQSAEEYAVECALLKVAGSETLDYVVDEGVQVFGGYGYSAEYPVERAYRDSRINRIFEGTNEINRLLTVDMLLKRALKGRIDLMTPAKKVQAELTGLPEKEAAGEGPFADERQALAGMKKSALLVAGAAVQKHMNTLQKEQEILMNIADMVLETFLSESLLLRLEKLAAARGLEACGSRADMLRVWFSDSMDRLALHGRTAVHSFAAGDEQRMLLMGLKRFCKYGPVNTKESRRRILQEMAEAGRYCF
jgi:alkylation response protein AidB-like acyl-CoA dehydrogenase